MLTSQQNKHYAEILKTGIEEIGTHQYNQAIETFLKAIKINEKSWIGHQAIALCKSMIFLVNNQQSIQCLESVISELNLSLDLSNELKRNIS